MKEDVFLPLLRKHGDDQAGRCRPGLDDRRIVEESSVTLRLCPELKILRDRVAQVI